MIFSHFKRGKGIRFDDGFRHSARDREVDPLVATYDAILATDPTVPVLLQLTEYRGQQVLWQDPECTIPVEDIGDPIGGVRHPETGEILAVQTTDADRPVWGGREVGASLDEGQWLEVPLSAFDIGQTDIFSIFMTVDKFDADHRSSFFTSTEGGAVEGIALSQPSNSRNTAHQFILGDGESFFNSGGVSNPSNLRWFEDIDLTGVVSDTLEGTHTLYFNGETADYETGRIPPSNTLKLGRMAFTGPGFYEGNSKFLVVYEQDASADVPTLLEAAQ